MATATKPRARKTAEPKPVLTEPVKQLFAEVEEVKEFAESLSDEFLECREMNHIWKAWTGQYVEGGILRILRCQRCKCERHQEISLSGTILSSHYKHPEGYLHKGMGRIVGDGRDALRVESLTRFMTKQAAKTAPKKAAAAKQASPVKTTIRKAS